MIAICTPCTVVSRSSLMSLIITFMFEPAKLQMNWARASGASTPRIAPGGRSGGIRLSHRRCSLPPCRAARRGRWPQRATRGARKADSSHHTRGRGARRTRRGSRNVAYTTSRSSPRRTPARAESPKVADHPVIGDRRAGVHRRLPRPNRDPARSRALPRTRVPVPRQPMSAWVCGAPGRHRAALPQACAAAVLTAPRTRRSRRTPGRPLCSVLNTSSSEVPARGNCDRGGGHDVVRGTVSIHRS